MNRKNLFNKHSLLDVISFSGFLTAIKLLLSLISQKFVAIWLGASGMALMANFRNVLELATVFSSAGTQNGVVAYYSEHQNQTQLRSFFSTVISLLLSMSILIIVILFWNANTLNFLIFDSLDDNHIFIKAIAVVVPFIAINSALEGVLTGIKLYKPVTKIQFFSTAISLVPMIPLIYYYQLNGAFTALLLRPVSMLILTLYFFRNSNLIQRISFELKFKREYFHELLPFIFMSFLSIGLLALTNLGIRITITEKIDLDQAGFWSAITSISSNYFLFINVAFTLYVFPKFAEKNNFFNLKNEARHILNTLLPIVSMGLLLVYVLRDFFIQLLFTDSFEVISPLFKWQILADWFRVIFLVFAYFIVAKKRVKDYFIVEVVSFLVFFILAFLLIDVYGIEGVVIANFLRYLVCLSVVLVLLRKPLTIHKLQK